MNKMNLNKSLIPYILSGLGLLCCTAMLAYNAPAFATAITSLPKDTQVMCGFVGALLLIMVAMLLYTLSLGRIR